VVHCIWKAPLCLSLSMTAVSPHPIQLCHLKVTLCCLLRKSSTANSSSAVASNFRGALGNNKNITTHKCNSFIYRHILVLNLHSMCAAHIAPLFSWFVTYFIHFPTYLCSSWFLPLTPLFIFHFFIKLVALVSHICYFCVYFYQHQFHFQTESTATFYSMVLVRLEFFFCLYLLLFLNCHLLSCVTVYCISLLVRVSV